MEVETEVRMGGGVVYVEEFQGEWEAYYMPRQARGPLLKLEKYRSSRSRSSLTSHRSGLKVIASEKAVSSRFM